MKKHLVEADTRLYKLQVHRLDLSRETGPIDASLSLLGNDINIEAITELLHEQEKKRARALRFEQRRHAYITGRAAAKYAICQLVEDQAPETILVEQGVFGQPVVEQVDGKNIQVSISHSGDCGAALAYLEHHPMGIDLELIDQANVASVLSQSTEHEKKLINSSGLPLEEACAMVWSMKESLSKVLRSGLMSPLDTYEIESVKPDNGYYVALFSRFAQYRSVSFRYHDMRCAVTLPRKTAWHTPAASIEDY